jgi:hypothetical protein
LRRDNGRGDSGGLYRPCWSAARLVTRAALPHKL